MLILPGKEEKAQYVQKMFNSIAKRYDLMNSLMTFALDRRWRRFVVLRSEIKEGGRALDICCGTGMLALELAKTVGKKGSVIGLDFSEEMLKIAQKKLSNAPYTDTVEFLQGDAMNLPFEDDSFDTVTVAWGLRNVPELDRVISEMQRVVKPGKKILSLDMAKPSAPVFKQVYWLYFQKLVPFMGKIWAGKQSAYNYLYGSSLNFPHQERLTEMFAEAGLKETKYSDLAGGVVAVVEGRK